VIAIDSSTTDFRLDQIQNLEKSACVPWDLLGILWDLPGRVSLGIHPLGIHHLGIHPGLANFNNAGRRKHFVPHGEPGMTPPKIDPKLRFQIANI